MSKSKIKKVVSLVFIHKYKKFNTKFMVNVKHYKKGLSGNNNRIKKGINFYKNFKAVYKKTKNNKCLLRS
jgi:hypothetical protein